MRRRLAVTVGMWLLTGVALVAADFWVEKDFTTWSDKEIQKMLTDSPWAKQVRIIVSGSLTEGPDAQVTIPEIPECGGEQFDRIQRTKVTITWSSALPIKQALIRQAIGLDAPIPAEGQQVLDRAEPFYVVTVSELPQAFAWLAGMGDALKSETMLKRKDKAPIAPAIRTPAARDQKSWDARLGGTKRDGCGTNPIPDRFFRPPRPSPCPDRRHVARLAAHFLGDEGAVLPFLVGHLPPAPGFPRPPVRSPCDRSMILLQEVGQVSDRPMSAAAAPGSFRFHGWNRRAVQACLIGVNDAGLRMRRSRQGLADQPSGCRGIAQR